MGATVLTIDDRGNFLDESLSEYIVIDHGVTQCYFIVLLLAYGFSQIKRNMKNKHVLFSYNIYIGNNIH